jgi:hypothetical protein
MNNYFKISALLIVIFTISLSGCGTITITPSSAASTPSTSTTILTSPTTSAGFDTTTSAAAVTSTSTAITTTSVPITSTATAITTTLPVTTSAPSVPPLYQPLYNQLQGYVTNSINLITAQWDGSSYPVNYSAELITADTNAGPGILQNSEQQTMINELNGEAAMGVKAVTVEIGCPVFDPNFYIFSGQTATQAQQTVQSWFSYYQSLAQAIHSRGLKMIVESNPLLSYYISSASSFNPGAYYKTLTFAAYEQLRSQHNIILAQQIKPDYLILQTEPQTDAINDFRPELNNATQDVAMINSFVNDLNNAGITGLHTSILIGSGAGTWQPDWKSYFIGLVAIPGLDKIDTHIYNLQPGVNQLGEVTIACQIADMAHVAGKGVTMSEFWFHKSSALIGLTENGDSLTDIRVRDMFSFWAPLDAQAFQMLSDLANYKHFDYVSAFGHYNWFALVDYNSLQTTPVYPPANSTQNATVDDQITTTLNQAAKQALADKLLSPVGKAYQSIISGQLK